MIGDFGVGTGMVGIGDQVTGTIWGAVLRGSSAFVVDLTASRELSASVGGASGLTAQLTVTSLTGLSATFGASSDFVATTTTVWRGLAATLGGTSGLSGSISTGGLGAYMPGRAGLGADLSLARGLAATLVGTSGLSTSVGRDVAATATLAGGSGLAATLGMAVRPVAVLGARSGLQGALTVRYHVVVVLGGGSALAGNLSVVRLSRPARLPPRRPTRTNAVRFMRARF